VGGRVGVGGCVYMCVVVLWLFGGFTLDGLDCFSIGVWCVEGDAAGATAASTGRAVQASTTRSTRSVHNNKRKRSLHSIALPPPPYTNRTRKPPKGAHPG